MDQTVASLDGTAFDTEIDEHAGFGAVETERGRLPLVAMDVRTRVSDLTAQTTVRQTFQNSLDDPLEATYVFPLPDRAAVTRFQMRVADRTIDGQLKERGEAREEYTQAIEKGHRAAIAEEDRSGVFSLRVGNIPPGEETTVELTLIGPLPVSDGEATFRFPLVVAPRYTPGIPLDGASVGDGVAPDTDQVPDASRVTPPVLLPGFPNPVRLSLEVELEPAGIAAGAEDWTTRVRSSLHSTIAEGGPPWVIRLHPGERLNRDFVLRFPVTDRLVTTSLKASPARDDDPGVFALTLLPPTVDVAKKPAPREVVFVLDRSGSMSGWKMVAARRTLGRMIDTLLDQDRFAVLAFDNTIERPPEQKSGFVAGSNRQRWKTLEWLTNIQSRGGTEMGPALTAAMRLFSKPANDTSSSPAPKEPASEPRLSENGFERILVVITDGQVTGEDAVLRGLAREAGAEPPRIFTVGIDRAVNAGFLRRLAGFGGGNCELVESEDRLDEAMDRIHRLIGKPVLTEVRIEPVNSDWIGDSVAPSRVPDLYVDRPITVFGRHLSSDASIGFRIRATDASNKAWQHEIVGQPAPADMLKSMWGRARVRKLEDDYAAGRARNAKELMKEVISVSLETHVLSRFTAYVAVDGHEIVNKGGEQQRIVQPVESPAGWGMRFAKKRPQAFAGGSILSSMVANVASISHAFCAKPTIAPLDNGDTANSILSELTDTAIDFCETSTEPIGGATDADSAPIVRLVQLMITEAVQLRATEIHIEPLVDRIRLQYLVEGKLVERDNPPLRLLDAIIARIKNLAKIALSGTEHPLSGQIRLSIGQNEVEIEVAISRSTHGETVVMRLKPTDTTSSKATQSTPRDRKRFWT